MTSFYLKSYSFKKLTSRLEDLQKQYPWQVKPNCGKEWERSLNTTSAKFTKQLQLLQLLMTHAQP